MANVTSDAGRATVLVYSPWAPTLAAVRTAVGRRPSGSGPRIDWLECETGREVRLAMEGGDVDLAILDGEAQPTGGMGLSRQFKYEINDCPPIIVLVARKQDAWLSKWSLGDAVISQPIDPIVAAATVADLLLAREREIPVVR
jgi:DNA-binding response OmpR family regulator